MFKQKFVRQSCQKSCREGGKNIISLKKTDKSKHNLDNHFFLIFFISQFYNKINREKSRRKIIKAKLESNKKRIREANKFHQEFVMVTTRWNTNKLKIPPSTLRKKNQWNLHKISTTNFQTSCLIYSSIFNIDKNQTEIIKFLFY